MFPCRVRAARPDSQSEFECNMPILRRETTCDGAACLAEGHATEPRCPAVAIAEQLSNSQIPCVWNLDLSLFPSDSPMFVSDERHEPSKNQSSFSITLSWYRSSHISYIRLMAQMRLLTMDTVFSKIEICVERSIDSNARKNGHLLRKRKRLKLAE